MSTQIVRLQDAEYDCGLCGVTHTYNTSDEYSAHQDHIVGSKRWIYSEVKEDA